MDRIIGELEAIYQSQPTTWLPVESIGMMLTYELGYEDEAEFEDAIKCTFAQFLSTLPHIELETINGTEVSATPLAFRPPHFARNPRYSSDPFDIRPVFEPPDVECGYTNLLLRAEV
jgi:hypothetical protein